MFARIRLLFSYDRRTFFMRLLFVLSILFGSFVPPLPATGVNDTVNDAITDVNDLSNSTWYGFMRFVDAQIGSHVDGMAELKRYFHRFGYLPAPPQNLTFSDLFDDDLRNVLLAYQRNLGLPETGELDRDTVSLIVAPRCGVPDHPSTSAATRLKTTRRFNYFYGSPRWNRRSPVTLSYAFSRYDSIGYLAGSDVREAFARAFERWSAVIPVNFTEAEDYSSADVKIGWYGGDHGDGEAFDGMLGVLAHAFSPENGRLHLDAAERWAVDFRAERSKVAVDLESVATHEIGHVLGLAHSSVKEAVMYPSLSPRSRKRELRRDDVAGIQALYGPNPNFRYDSRLDQSDISSGSGGMKGDVMVVWTSATLVITIVASLWL